jgi:DNA-3-methyladenine glycosylase
MRSKATRDRDLCSGPAKLCQALGISGAQNGVDLTRRASSVRIVDDGTPPPDLPAVSTRIGLTVAVDEQWRWYLSADENVSRK